MCPMGGYKHIRHNELCNSIENLLCDVCHDVEIDSHLQLLQGETFALKSTTNGVDAKFNIKANGLRNRGSTKPILMLRFYIR